MKLQYLSSACSKYSPFRFGARLAVAGLLLLTSAGCSSWLPEMVPFGAVNAPDYNRSLNGLGMHRKMWESAGAKCLTPQKLSPKLNSMDVIVLVGQSHQPPGIAARRWLEQWLGEEEGRSVIYFGRDFNADVYYRTRTLDQLPPTAQMRGKQLLAVRQVRELNQRLRQLPESTFCGWFFLETEQQAVEYREFEGPWAANLDSTQGYWPVQIALLPPDDAAWRNRKPSWLGQAKSAGASAGKTDAAPTSVDSEDVVESMDEEDADTTVRRSQWEPEELATDAQWAAELNRSANSEILLSGHRDEGNPLPLVFRLTSDRFPESQIIVAANGAPMLNGSLVDRLHQQVGQCIIESCLPASRVALLAYDSGGLLISDAPEADAKAAGLEMLTVWPLSAITMPAALLGVIVCAALLPILGRPQPLRNRSQSDFGLHIEAIGRMLYEARDSAHAQSVIQSYFRKVRGEAPPHWLDSLEIRHPPASSPSTTVENPIFAQGTMKAATADSGSGPNSVENLQQDQP